MFFFSQIDVNLLGRDGETPLHTAARYESLSNINTISYLVSHQANLSKKDNHSKQEIIG